MDFCGNTKFCICVFFLLYIYSPLSANAFGYRVYVTLETVWTAEIGRFLYFENEMESKEETKGMLNRDFFLIVLILN